MKLPIKWLKEYVDTRLPAEKIAEKLTMAGLEVEEIVSGHSYSGVVVGKVLAVDKHPNADKLRVASVDVGEETLQIVCGASNLATGQTVPVAIVGAKLGDYEISKASLRGVDSHGMICSAQELGIGDDHSGIMVLEKGQKIGEVYVSDKGADTVLDVKVLANRPDCMSVIGLANEVAVATKTPIKIPPIKLTESAEKVEFAIKVEDDKFCPRYMARFVTNLQNGETPAWMKERLTACGVRPLSLFVDISNYVMLEYGQPLHFFDLDKLADKTIIVRSAKTGEEITTLDGMKRKLTKDNLVIADSKAPIALAGVMGGATTEIDEHTENILVEAAVFDKASIRRTSRSLGLRSEAVARFEKGIALMLPEVAINRAAELLQELGKGKVSKTTMDIRGAVNKSKPVDFDIAKMNVFLGTNISEKEAAEVLKSLGFVLSKGKRGYDVTAPFWRTDIVEDVDLYEEVIRIVGYDRIPATLPYAVETVPATNKAVVSADMIRDRLSAIGFMEILTYSFVGAKDLSALGVSIATAPEVQNPLVSDQQYFRPTLVPKMLEALRDNQFNQESLRFFEIGRSFESLGGGKLPKEANWLSLGMTSDYYDAKGSIYNLLTIFGITDDEIVIKSTNTDFFKKGIGADLYFQGKKLVTLGEICEDVREKFDVKRSVVLALLNLDILLALDLPVAKFEQFSKFQRVTRDVSAVFPDDKTVAEIRQKLARANKLVTKVDIIDIYKGKGLNPLEKSVSIRFYVQSDDHTLTDLEVDEIMQIVGSKITEIGGKLRSGK